MKYALCWSVCNIRLYKGNMELCKYVPVVVLTTIINPLNILRRTIVRQDSKHMHNTFIVYRIIQPMYVYTYIHHELLEQVEHHKTHLSL